MCLLRICTDSTLSCKWKNLPPPQLHWNTHHDDNHKLQTNHRVNAPRSNQPQQQSKGKERKAWVYCGGERGIKPKPNLKQSRTAQTQRNPSLRPQGWTAPWRFPGPRTPPSRFSSLAPWPPPTTRSRSPAIAPSPKTSSPAAGRSSPPFSPTPPSFAWSSDSDTQLFFSLLPLVGFNFIYFFFFFAIKHSSLSAFFFLLCYVSLFFSPVRFFTPNITWLSLLCSIYSW